VSELEFNVPFQHKHGYIRDELRAGVGSTERAVVIYAYEGRWALGIAGSGVA